MTIIGDAPPDEAIERADRRAVAQARRDRAKLQSAQIEIAALRDREADFSARVAALERSPSRRLFWPARRFMRLMKRFRQPPAAVHAAPAADAETGRPGRGLVLVIDHHWPRPDRDSGSMDIVNLVLALGRLGFEPILAASREHDRGQPAQEALSLLGIRCLNGDDAASVEAFVQAHGSDIDLCVMCRVFCGGEFLETLQSHSRQARLIFNAIDLNYLREARKAELLDDKALLITVPSLRDREEHVIRNSDATLVVSERERQILGETLPDSLVMHLPLARDIHVPKRGFDGRSGIGFIGGFAHAPNVDAVRYFLAEIWPHVQAVLPLSVFTIVGADAPEDLGRGMPSVHVLGHQPDIKPWFDQICVSVAPLRFGAGAKGKVASSLAHGVPCILTGIAAEGMSLSDGNGVVVCDTPEAFAAAVIRGSTDGPYWQALSDAGLAYAEKTLSPAAWQARLDNVVSRIGL